MSQQQLLEDVCKRLAAQDGGMLVAAARALSLTDPGYFADARNRAEAATQLRDNLDVFTTGPNYVVFLRKVMPVFIHILNGPCIFQSNSHEQVSAPAAGRLLTCLPHTSDRVSETSKYHTRDATSIPYTSRAD